MTNLLAEILLEVFPNAKIINCKKDSFHNLVAIYQQCLNNLPGPIILKILKNIFYI